MDLLLNQLLLSWLLFLFQKVALATVALIAVAVEAITTSTTVTATNFCCQVEATIILTRPPPLLTHPLRRRIRVLLYLPF